MAAPSGTPEGEKAADGADDAQILIKPDGENVEKKGTNGFLVSLIDGFMSVR